MAKIFTGNLKGRKPLYHQYPRQFRPQGAYIEIDTRDGSVMADWNPEIGNAVPSDVYNGAVVRIPITASAPKGKLVAFLKAHSALFDAVCNVDSATRYNAIRQIQSAAHDAGI